MLRLCGAKIERRGLRRWSVSLFYSFSWCYLLLLLLPYLSTEYLECTVTVSSNCNLKHEVVHSVTKRPLESLESPLIVGLEAANEMIRVLHATRGR